MFTFSFGWLNRISKYKLDLNEVINILDLQGFDVKLVENINEDTIVSVEVKANRPDAMSHFGILREIYAYKSYPEPVIKNPIDSSVINLGTDIGIGVNVGDTKSVRRFSLIKITNISNDKYRTPKYIQDYLHALGVNVINPVVDIVNYMMLESGQPMHAYDFDKIHGNQVIVNKLQLPVKFQTLDNSTKDIPKGTIVISDSAKVLAVAGVIGGLTSAVDEKTRTILLESANFDQVDIRLTARALKLSTLSSFRFERGVDISNSLTKAIICANMIAEVCGGTIQAIYDSYPEPNPAKIIDLSVDNVNKKLGIKLNIEDIRRLLDKYYFENNIKNDNTLAVTSPSYRLDLSGEIDVIEEVARIYGYHNIEPTMPVVTATYLENTIQKNSDKVKETLVGVGFYETMNYSFIPNNSMDVLGIEVGNNLYSDIAIQNPLSQYYSIMRSTLIYSLLENVIYNYTRGSVNLALFEFARTYIRDSSYDTNFKECDTAGIIFTGARIERGWGISKDIMFDYYDISNYLRLIFSEFGVNYCIEEESQPFFTKGTGIKIMIQGAYAGFAGQIDKSVISKMTNGKLVKNDVFYIEFNLECLCLYRKAISRFYKYPRITREYNFLVSKEIQAAQVQSIIQATSALIESVSVKDIYYGKGCPTDKNAILFQVVFGSEERTLTSDEAEKIEAQFLEELKNCLDVVFKL